MARITTFSIPVAPLDMGTQPEPTFADIQDARDRAQWAGRASLHQLPGSNGIQHQGQDDQ
jgi:hypothetical protein